MSSESVEMTREEAWRVYELLENLHRFLHQPDNYRTQEHVSRWLQSGVYAELRDVYYDVAAKWFPVDEESGRVLPPPGVVRKLPE